MRKTSFLNRELTRQIEGYFTKKRVVERIIEKAKFGDSLYEAMLRGAGRDYYVSMITYWSIGQGMGVQLRRWIEEFIRDLVLYQRDHFGREIEKVYTLADLKQGRYLRETDQVALAGEDEIEHSHKRQWNVPLRRSIVSAADRMAEAIFRAYQRRHSYWVSNGRRFVSALGGVLPDPTDELLDEFPVIDTSFQRHWLIREALNPREEPISKQRLICNLLVLEKPPGKVHAFRFASPGLGALRSLRDEKRNLLLLYGWLRQEKPFRIYEDSVEVHWAHLTPREVAPSQNFFFGPDETMEYRPFWDFLGVPYEVLMDSLEEAGQILSKHLSRVVRKAAPGSIRKLMPV